MFEDSLLERRITEGHRRGLATTISFALEAVLIGVLVLVPLIFTEALPTHELVTYLIAPAPPPPPPPPVANPQPLHAAKKAVISELADNGALRMPTRIPKRIQVIKDEEPPMVASTGGVVGGVPGGIPGGQLGGVIGGIIRATPVAHPKAPAPRVEVPKRIRVSQGVTEGMLIHKVMPRYPSLARQARIQGQVVLNAVIAKDGSIENLRLKSGHPMLAPAAIDAVSEWRYKPYLLNGHPVEVETQIMVNFTLAG